MKQRVRLSLRRAAKSRAICCWRDYEAFFQESFLTNWIFKVQSDLGDRIRIETRPGFFCPPCYP